VDLGVGDEKDDGLTVIVTIALMPNGQRLIVNVVSGHWQAPEILARLRETHRVYGSEILVESNAAQKYIVDLTRGDIPVHGLHTSARNKFSEQWGVESLAVELRNMLWIMPSGTDGQTVAEEGVALWSECLHYDPNTHTGDRLMALWLARECARRWSGSKGSKLDTQRR
jgi:hypothetical protein